MEMESCVPPGFRFHPTEEELVGYYLKKKINSLKIDLDVIGDIDLYRMEPWEIQDKCKMGYDEQNEWYFFSHKDKKYPTGTRTNRATAAGFWKATGRDKAVMSKNRIIGMRKTLVFYKGRAPNGRKTDWIMHEYRLQTSEHAPPQEEGWVVCRAFKKPTPNHRQGFEAWTHAQYANRQANAMAMAPRSFSDMMNPMHAAHSNQGTSFYQEAFGSEQDFAPNPIDDQLVDLPKLDSPTLSTSLVMKDATNEDCDDERNGSQYIDWKKLDELLASQPGEGTSSFPQSSSQMYELDAQNHAGHHAHYLGWVPDF